MAKLEKSKLEQLTVEAMRVAGTAMSLLVVMRCPVRQEYEQIEHFLQRIDEVRKSLGLQPVGQEELVHGKPIEHKPIGFRLPEAV